MLIFLEIENKSLREDTAKRSTLGSGLGKFPGELKATIDNIINCLSQQNDPQKLQTVAKDLLSLQRMINSTFPSENGSEVGSQRTNSKYQGVGRAEQSNNDSISNVSSDSRILNENLFSPNQGLGSGYEKQQ